MTVNDLIDHPIVGNLRKFSRHQVLHVNIVLKDVSYLIVIRRKQWLLNLVFTYFLYFLCLDIVNKINSSARSSENGLYLSGQNDLFLIFTDNKRRESWNTLQIFAIY